MSDDIAHWYRSPLSWILLWLVLLLTGLLTRTYLPVDETRYVSVAWEMWLRGDFLVPYLNGEPYSHKAPLLFWLMHAGWWLIGVNDYTPRLVSPAFALLALFLTRALARELWPDRDDIAAHAPWLLLGASYFATMVTMTMFDTLVTCCVLLALFGVVRVARSADCRYWLLVGTALGLGVLAKGPVILLHVLPAILLAPWWLRQARLPWPRWVMGMLSSLLLAAMIGLAWALPAAQAGGAEYANAIFWGQSADRIHGEEAPHAAPVWWYVPILAAMLLPWLAWPALWRGITALRRTPRESAIRFCLAWSVPVFIAFSLISGKRPHYLLPLLPAFALLGARALASLSRERIYTTRGAALLLIAFGALYSALAWNAPQLDDASWLALLSPYPGLLPIAIGLGLAWLPARTLMQAVTLWTLISVSAVIFIHTQIITHMMPAYDVRPVARVLQTAQLQGIPIANLAKYHGQYQFLGRLGEPLAILDDADLAAWADQHDKGLIVAYYRHWPADASALPAGARHAQPYRGGGLIVWDAAALAAQPAWAKHWPTENATDQETVTQ